MELTIVEDAQQLSKVKLRKVVKRLTAFFTKKKQNQLYRGRSCLCITSVYTLFIQLTMSSYSETGRMIYGLIYNKHTKMSNCSSSHPAQHLGDV